MTTIISCISTVGELMVFAGVIILLLVMGFIFVGKAKPDDWTTQYRFAFLRHRTMYQKAVLIWFGTTIAIEILEFFRDEYIADMSTVLMPMTLMVAGYFSALVFTIPIANNIYIGRSRYGVSSLSFHQRMPNRNVYTNKKQLLAGVNAVSLLGEKSLGVDTIEMASPALLSLQQFRNKQTISRSGWKIVYVSQTRKVNCWDRLQFMIGLSQHIDSSQPLEIGIGSLHIVS